jgi:hypothetical protein
MRIGAGIFLIAVGAILRFGISTVSTHGIGVHTIGDILMVVGVLGVLLWLVVWAPWARSRGAAYRRPVPPDEAVYRRPVPPDEAVYRRPVSPDEDVATARRYPADRPYEDEYPQ